MRRPVFVALERLALRLGLVMLAVFLALFVLPQIWHLFSPFIIALPVAALLQPLIRFFQEKLHCRRGFAVGFWVLLVCALLLLVVYWFISFVVVQVINAASNAPTIISSFIGVLQTASDRILDAVQSMPAAIGDTIRASLDSAFHTVSEAGLSLAGGLVNASFGFAAGLPYALIYANFLILGILLITNRYDLFRAYLRRGEGSHSNDSLRVLRQSAGRGLVGYVRVQLLFSVLTFLLSWVFFQALGFPYAMLIGLAAGLLELIPQFGCGTLYIPWSVICFIIGNARSGWLVLGLYLVYSLIRRVTEPALLGSNLGVSPLLSLIGMFAGMRLAGVPGLILGPVVMVVLNSAVRARLFDGILADCRIVYRSMRSRWRTGQEVHDHANP